VIVSELDLRAELPCKLLRYQRGPQSIEGDLLALREGRHEAQIVPERMLLSQRTQPLRAPCEQARRVGEADARNGSFGKRLNLGGI
jgi:hypothetical protein